MTSSYLFSSYHVVKELKLKDLDKIIQHKPIVLTPLVLGYEIEKKSFCFIYNFGAIVFFNVSSPQQTQIINHIQSYLGKFFELSVMDEYFLEVNPKEKNRVAFNRVIVDQIDPDKIEMMSLVLAQSTALDYFEKSVSAILDDLKNLTEIVGRKNRRISDKTILAMIKRIIAIKQDIIVSLRLLEKPEAAWEKKVLDVLYEEGIAMFELKERYSFLKEKLQMIQSNMEVLSSFSNNRKMILLEAAIVALFVLDLSLVLYEIFFK